MEATTRETTAGYTPGNNLTTDGSDVHVTSYSATSSVDGVPSMETIRVDWIRFVLCGFSSVALGSILLLMVLLQKFRQKKVFKATSPNLLLIALTGMMVIEVQVIVLAATPVIGNVECVVHNWIRHVGFGLTYVTMTMKTWRISFIMKSSRCRDYLTTDEQICKSIAAILVLTLVYLLVWTTSDPDISIPIVSDSFRSFAIVSGSFRNRFCAFSWWEIILTSGEVMFLFWGLWLCYGSRHAPQPFNDTRPISYAFWNEIVCSCCYIFCRESLQSFHNYFILIIFIRTHATLGVTAATLFAPKLLMIYGENRKVKSRVVLDCDGASGGCGAGRNGVHRVALTLSKRGTVKDIYCVPCGPLSQLCPDGDDDDDDADGAPDRGADNRNHGPPQGGDGGDAKENHYTRDEVDNLIQMLATIKSECELYKAQAKQLARILSSGLSNSRPITTPETDLLDSVQSFLCTDAAAYHIPHKKTRNNHASQLKSSSHVTNRTLARVLQKRIQSQRVGNVTDTSIDQSDDRYIQPRAWTTTRSKQYLTIDDETLEASNQNSAYQINSNKKSRDVTERDSLPLAGDIFLDNFESQFAMDDDEQTRVLKMLQEFHIPAGNGDINSTRATDKHLDKKHCTSLHQFLISCSSNNSKLPTRGSPSVHANFCTNGSVYEAELSYRTEDESFFGADTDLSDLNTGTESGIGKQLSPTDCLVSTIATELSSNNLSLGNSNNDCSNLSKYF